MKRIFISALALAAATALGGPRPARVMSGYTGYFLGGFGREHVENMIDLMAENGFNAIDVKVHSSLQKKKLIDNSWQELSRLLLTARTPKGSSSTCTSIRSAATKPPLSRSSPRFHVPWTRLGTKWKRPI